MPGAGGIDKGPACLLLPSQLWVVGCGFGDAVVEGSGAEASLSLFTVSLLARQPDAVAVWGVWPCLGPGAGFPAWI